MPKRVIILGATGSIGRAALDVIGQLGACVRVVGLAGGTNWRLLAEQARRVGAGSVAIRTEKHAEPLASACGPDTRLYAGPNAAVELVQDTDADFVISAIVGAAGLDATLAAVERGLDIGLANKESLVIGGGVIMPLALRHGSRIIPIDSEHSAVFQALASGAREEVARVILTASGGPFRTWTHAQMEHATLEDALNHPTWSMGVKVTIDSATMMNKALEIIEATHLFGLPRDRIDVLVHPESIVHSLVEFRDHSIIAQLGAPDMRTPIQYALTYPQRAAGVSQRLDLSQALRLHFEPPDLERFPALRAGFEAAERGGVAGAVLNAANEVAVEQFRASAISFGRIAAITEEICHRQPKVENPTMDDIRAADAWARDEVLACCAT